MGSNLQSEGPCLKYFLQWVSQRRELQDRLILHENVPRMGTFELKQHLGGKYYIERAVVTPTELGWASARPRQITVLILRKWLDEVLHATGIPPEVATHKQYAGEHFLKHFLHVARLLFKRGRDITLNAYLCEELSAA